MMNPFVQNYGHIKALESIIETNHKDTFLSMVSFTKRCTFKVDAEYRKIASKELIVYDIELSEFIHRKLNVLKLQHKEPLLTDDDISSIFTTLSNANITDPKIREEHVKRLKTKSVEKTSQPSSCIVCNKPVSDKVKAYCLSNKQFNGKIYCYEHQKTIKVGSKA